MVVDRAAVIDSEEFTILSEKNILILEQEPTVDNPVINFSIGNVLEKELEQRIQVERSIQKYRPKWGIWVIGVTGAAFAGIAANSSLLQTSATKSEKIALNITSGLVTALTVLQMKPAEDPVFTGETRLMRRSGFETVTDTVNVARLDTENFVNISVIFKDTTLLEEQNVPLTNGNLSLNIASIVSDSDVEVTEDSQITVQVDYLEEIYQYQISLSNILMKYVEVTEPITVLRNAPALSELNIVTEVGEGSAFQLLESVDENWYRVRFGGSDVFVQKSVTEITWISEASSDAVDVFEFTEAPFGEIDVENSVPILRNNNPEDRAVIITNGQLGYNESSQYIERDFKLFEFYMKSALQMQESQIFRIEVDSTGLWENEFRNIAESDSSGLLYVYISGTSRVENGELHFENSLNQSDSHIEMASFFDWFEQINPGKIVLMADLDFNVNSQENGNSTSEAVLQNVANELLRKVPNSALIFSHRPGQDSSLYAGASTENKRHHIFLYYWADAIKNRSDTVSEMIRHLENNVDYTSRRLHDKPQEIQAFGNFTISVRE